MNIEDDLRNALRREQPPPNFAAGVLAKTAPARVKPALLRRPAVFALAAALAAAALLPPAVFEYRRREEARGLEAKRELLIALSLTRTKLLQVKEQIHRNTRNAL